MKHLGTCIRISIIVCVLSAAADAQDWAQRWVFGVGGSAQRLSRSVDDSRTVVNAGTSDSIRYRIDEVTLGYGAMGFVGYRFSNRIGLTLNLGYSPLPFRISESNLGLERSFSFKSNLIYGDLLFDIVLARQGIFYPFVNFGAGGGVFRFSGGGTQSFTESHWSAGAGVKVLLNSQMALELGGTFNRTNDDILDAVSAGGRDSFLNIRVALSFLSRPIDLPEPVMVADRPAPSLPVVSSSPAKNQAAPPTRSLAGTASTFSQVYLRGKESYAADRFVEALEIFESLINDYPTHPLVGNCYYLSGQSHYRLKDYSASLAAHQQVLATSSELKKDNSLFMIAMCHIRLKSYGEARQALERILNDYPESDTAEKAGSLLAKLK